MPRGRRVENDAAEVHVLHHLHQLGERHRLVHAGDGV